MPVKDICRELGVSVTMFDNGVIGAVPRVVGMRVFAMGNKMS